VKRYHKLAKVQNKSNSSYPITFYTNSKSGAYWL